MRTLHAWHTYWLIWFTVAFVTFLGPEIYGLLTNAQRTLSAAVWSMEKVEPGQPISGWTAFHFLFIGVLLILFVWLIGHFAFGIWR